MGVAQAGQRQEALKGLTAQQLQAEAAGKQAELTGAQISELEERRQMDWNKLATSQDQFNKEYSLKNKALNAELDQFEKKLQTMQYQFERGLIHEADMTRLRGDIEKDIKNLTLGWQANENAMDRAWKSNEKRYDRDAQEAMNRLDNATKVRVARIQAEAGKGGFLGKLLSGIGQIGVGAVTGGAKGTLAGVGAKLTGKEVT